MSAVPQFGFYNVGVSTNFNSTIYLTITGGRGSAASSATESQRQVTYETPGTLSKLTVVISANTIATSATTVRTRVNAANGGQSISIAAGTTGIFQDLTNTDSLSGGEELNLQLVTPNTSGAITIQANGTLFSASSNTVVRYGGRSASSNSSNLTFYGVVSGSQNSFTPEANAQVKSSVSGTLKNLFVNVVSNTRIVTTTISTRVNGADGNQSVAYTSLQSGLMQDVTNTDTIASGDLFNTKIVYLSDTGLITYGLTSAIDLETTDDTTMLIQSGSNTQAANLTRYLGVGGDGSFTTYTTESDSQIYALASYTVSKLNCYVSTNTVSATSTFRFRKNGADGNQSVSITASTTGFYEDATNSDSVTSTDTINYSLITGATGTALLLANTSMLATVSGGGGGSSTPRIFVTTPARVASGSRSASGTRGSVTSRNFV